MGRYFALSKMTSETTLEEAEFVDEIFCEEDELPPPMLSLLIFSSSPWLDAAWTRILARASVSAACCKLCLGLHQERVPKSRLSLRSRVLLVEDEEDAAAEDEEEDEEAAALVSFPMLI